MPFPRRYQQYEHFLVPDDNNLQVRLQALSITSNTVALPPRKRHAQPSPIFPPLPKPTHISPAPPLQPLLSDRLMKAIVSAAAREKRRKAARDTNPRSQKPPKKLHTVQQSQQSHQPQHQPTRDEHDRTEFRTARSRLPIKRRAGIQATRQRPQQRLKPLHRRAINKPTTSATPPETDKDLPEVPNVEPRLVEAVMSEMLETSPNVDWDDIAGLQFAKNCVMEAVVWPMLRPDIFTGLRGPPKGLLLFGPPGTGKTMIGRAIASKSGAKFFNISASSLVSKWAGEGEKTVRALFAVARVFQPSVVFIDEIDSLLTSRSEGEQEFSRRIKTEFLVQMDGAATSRDDRVLVVGATNRPQELDEAARRRLVKRLYIPLPDRDARISLVKRLLEKQMHELSADDICDVAGVTKGYSGSDMYALCAEAALAPVRELGSAIKDVELTQVRPVRKADFLKAARMVRASVGEKDLAGYREWNERFGSFPSAEGEADASTASPTVV